MPAPIILLPSARRLINSLRDIGYDLPTAVADLVDNSIAARAQNVDVDFGFDGLDSWIRVADDGTGMGPTVLDEAMRYGTQRVYGRDDLGRFGLGLKTASLSQCRRLTVASRQGAVRRRIAVRQWDLECVARRNLWELLRPSPHEVRPEATAPLDEHPGTVVLWDGLDRILGHRMPEGAAARRALTAAAAEVRSHLAMVFHRYIAGDVARDIPLTLRLNGEPIEAWDPFARDEPQTVALEKQDLVLQSGRGWLTVTVRPYILPGQHRFSSAAAHARAAGPRRWNRQQGFYFYRNDRLLQAGGWNRIRTSDEHTKLARVAVDIPPDADEMFGVNVAKMRITIPSGLRHELTAIASGVTARASGAYRQHLSDTPLLAAEPARSGHSVDVPIDGGRARVPYGRLVRVLHEELPGQDEVVARILTRLAQERTASVSGQTLPAETNSAPATKPFVIMRRQRPADPTVVSRS